MPHLIVFSHLRWNFVFQRPQHLLMRLARHYPVTYIEEPVRSEGAAWLESSRPAPGVEVLCPHTPIEAGGFHDDQLPALEPLLAAQLGPRRLDDCIVWFYTPMALPMLGEFRPRAVVYDCMDELSACRDAPRQMRQRETALLKLADVVLTGGPSLYEAKRHLHPHVLCLPSAVDAEHYAAANALAQQASTRRAAELQQGIRTPRLGFFGVIDERLDLGLVAALADARPSWQIVMVGPVARIGRDRLPQRPNIHWLGLQPYELLPQLVAGWDACLMPFALNEATRYISPTKTLEYMAAGKPVISTPVHDVKAMFSDVVRIAGDTHGFIEACQAALHETPHALAERLADMQACVWRYSWDETAAAVHRSIEAALTRAARPLAPMLGSATAGSDAGAGPTATRLPVASARAHALGGAALAAGDPDLKVASAG